MALADRSNLSGQLWPPFAEAVHILSLWVDYYGLRGSIESGYRSLEEQERLYAIGRTSGEIRARVKKKGQGGAVTDAAPGESAHNYGLAVDVYGPDQLKIVALAKELGFGTVSWDPPHLEWPNWRSLLSK